MLVGVLDGDTALGDGLFVLYLNDPRNGTKGRNTTWWRYSLYLSEPHLIIQLGIQLSEMYRTTSATMPYVGLTNG